MLILKEFCIRKGSHSKKPCKSTYPNVCAIVQNKKVTPQKIISKLSQNYKLLLHIV